MSMLPIDKSEAGTSGEPVVLGLDTSTASLAAAVLRGGETLAAVQSLAERNHSVLTVTQVKELLERSNIAPERLDGIAIGRGPGSYTGMRIAVSVGKTLAWIWNKPLVGVSSLEALAYGAMRARQPRQAGAAVADRKDKRSGRGGAQEAAAGPQAHDAVPDNSNSPGRPDSHAEQTRTEWFVPMMDARRGQVYTAAFAVGGGREWERIAPDGVRLMEDWAGRLEEMSGASGDGDSPSAIWLVGDLSRHEEQCERLRTLCREREPRRDVMSLPFAMDGPSVALLGAKRLAAGERDDVHSFVPNYTQLAEAEVKLLERARQGRSEAR